MDISFSNEFCYMSACGLSPEMYFYSAPTSPGRLKLRALFDSQTDPTTPRETSYEDANFIVDEFEFDTSRRFNVSVSDLDAETNQKGEKNPFHDSLQTMAFADELFCNGKVLPRMPSLKLPPRLHKVGVGSLHYSKLASSISARSLSGLRLSRHRLWNDDFDPFMVALEKVREEKRRKPNARYVCRRSKSLSPFKGCSCKSNKTVGVSKSSQLESHCCDTTQVVCELEKGPLKEVSGRINFLSECKGLVFARQMTLAGVRNDTTLEKTSISKLAIETKKEERKRGGFCTRNKKRECTKKFLFGARNMGKTNSHNKLEDKMEAQEKPPSVRKLEMKAVTSTEPKRNGDPKTAELTKMRLVRRRPLRRLFLCLGYVDEKSSD